MNAIPMGPYPFFIQAMEEACGDVAAEAYHG